MLQNGRQKNPSKDGTFSNWSDLINRTSRGPKDSSSPGSGASANCRVCTSTTSVTSSAYGHSQHNHAHVAALPNTRWPTLSMHRPEGEFRMWCVTFTFTFLPVLVPKCVILPLIGHRYSIVTHIQTLSSQILLSTQIFMHYLHMHTPHCLQNVPQTV